MIKSSLKAGVVLLGQLVVHDEELEMHHPDSVHAIVTNVLGPCSALDVQELPLGRLLELHGDNGALVMPLVVVGEVLRREAPGGGVVAHGTQRLNVSWVLTVAVDPDLVLVLLLANVGLQGLRHVLWQVSGVVVGIILDPVDAVQLEVKAGLPFAVSEGTLGTGS